MADSHFTHRVVLFLLQQYRLLIVLLSLGIVLFCFVLHYALIVLSYYVILHLAISGWFDCKSDYVLFFGFECCVCILGYRMPPAKSSRGRPARQQQPTDCQTWSRTAARRPAIWTPARLPAALGATPPGVRGNMTWSVAWPHRCGCFYEILSMALAL